MKAVIVLEALQKGFNNCSSIVEYASMRQVSISEKTVRRHIKLLRDLGYIINESNRGFILAGEESNHKNVKFGPSAYPIIILKIIAWFKDMHPNQKSLVNLIKVYYGCKVNRKAVGRNIKALKTLGYQIKRDSHGGYLIASEDIKIDK